MQKLGKGLTGLTIAQTWQRDKEKKNMQIACKNLPDFDKHHSKAHNLFTANHWSCLNRPKLGLDVDLSFWFAHLMQIYLESEPE